MEIIYFVHACACARSCACVSVCVPVCRYVSVCVRVCPNVFACVRHDKFTDTVGLQTRYVYQNKTTKLNKYMCCAE